jgi:hypothetical protein
MRTKTPHQGSSVNFVPIYSFHFTNATRLCWKNELDLVARASDGRERHGEKERVGDGFDRSKRRHVLHQGSVP